MKKILLTSISLMAISTTVIAQDHNHNHTDHDAGFYGHLDTKTYFTDIYNAHEPSEEVVDIFSHSHFEGGYKFNDALSLNTTLTLEGDPAGHSHGGGATRTGDRFFDDHPLFIEELTFNYDTDHYGVYAGKFNPALGRDIHTVPGWWGVLVFEDFKIRERLGFGGYVDGDIDGLGTQKFDVSTFFADTTFLQESALYDRATIDGEDGGVANTEDFSSFAANLSGELGMDNLSYYIGYAHQANDTIGGDDESRFVFGLDSHYQINNDTMLNAMIDITDISHLNGEADHDRQYATAGLNFNYKQWIMGGSYTHVNNDAADADEGKDGYIAQTSIGYNFTNHFGVDLGYVAEKEEGEKSDRVGLLVRYGADF